MRTMNWEIYMLARETVKEQLRDAEKRSTHAPARTESRFSLRLPVLMRQTARPSSRAI
jgi:hypothetical protein